MGSQSFSKDVAKRGNLWQFDPAALVIIGVDTEDGPEHELWDERNKLAIEPTMVTNIMAVGVKQTVTIRKVTVDGEKRAEVVDGRRRVLHARAANEKLAEQGEPTVIVPCILESGDEEHVQNLSISLNEIRKDDGILVKAAKCMRLLSRNGGDKKLAAQMFGVSTTTIKNWTKLVELAPAVKKAVENGQISASAATQLHGMEKSEQVDALEKMTKEAKASGKKKATTKTAKGAASGKSTTPGKRVLMSMIEDEENDGKLDPAVVFGIKLALGEHVPGESSRMGKLLVKAGYSY